MQRINVAEIEYVEGCGKHASIALSSGKTIQTAEPLYAFESKLFLDDGFFKCHRSYLVNINHVIKYTSDELLMRSRCHIPIARSCRTEFKEAYFSVVFGSSGDEA